MRERRIFSAVYRVQDKRAKSDRIIQAIGEKSGFGQLRVRTTHTKFIEQYTEYGPTVDMHDDVLDAVAMAITWAADNAVEDWIEGEAYEVDDDLPRLNFRSAP
jgi:hypothetical protein